MSYQSPIDPAASLDPPRRHRPGTVSAAAIAMLAGAAVGLIYAIAALIASGSIHSQLNRFAGDSGATQNQIDQVGAGLQAVFIAAAVTELVLALVVAGLAVGVWHASNAARITTLVLVGLSICCGFGSSALAIGSASGDLTIQLQGMDQQTGRALGDAVGQAVPSWLGSAGGGLTCLQLLGYIAVFVLLLLPVSNAFFRRPTVAPAATTGSAPGAPNVSLAPEPPAAEPPSIEPPPSMGPNP
jgi:hypothetical protein